MLRSVKYGQTMIQFFFFGIALTYLSFR
uniref:Uncharacterized protein n=1 Tax=Anguilla anguilla TaxID=7936 RepID=A0A0E9UTP1_ANGAN